MLGEHLLWTACPGEELIHPAHHRPGILAAISQVLATYAINVDAVLQLPGHSREALPFAITLEPSNQQALDTAMAEIGKLHFLVQPPLCLPILRKRA